MTYSHFWSCSKFANWIRGTPKPSVGTFEDWEQWEFRARSNHPIRWWLAETGLDYLERIVYFIPDSLHSIKYYINNRWVTKTHSLTAHPKDIPPGKWVDVGNRFLPCLFNELQNFVEVELAGFNVVFENEDYRKKYNMPWWACGRWKWRSWRCPQSGIDYLDWQMKLTVDGTWGCEPSDPNYGAPTQQAIAAKEIFELYKWWTEVYRNRPDPYDESGWSDYCELAREEEGDSWLRTSHKNPELEELSKKTNSILRQIEQQYEQEDEEMLIRLIRVRNSLWT